MAKPFAGSTVFGFQHWPERDVEIASWYDRGVESVEVERVKEQRTCIVTATLPDGERLTKLVPDGANQLRQLTVETVGDQAVATAIRTDGSTVQKSVDLDHPELYWASETTPPSAYRSKEAAEACEAARAEAGLS